MRPRKRKSRASRINIAEKLIVCRNGLVAQVVERAPDKGKAVGSNPTGPIKIADPLAVRDMVFPAADRPLRAAEAMSAVGKQGKVWGRSSIGRAQRLQRWGWRFDSARLHWRGAVTGCESRGSDTQKKYFRFGKKKIERCSRLCYKSKFVTLVGDEQ